MNNYPVEFYTKKTGLITWTVFSVYPDGISRIVYGPTYSKWTALELEAKLTQHYRNGFDMGEKGVYSSDYQ